MAGVCADLANRRIRDVRIACCDGLVGSRTRSRPPGQATVQTCVVHLIRVAVRVRVLLRP